MAKINQNYDKLAAGYLFPEIARRTNAFLDSNQGAEVLRLGIGDTTEPIVAAVLKGLHDGVDSLGRRKPTPVMALPKESKLSGKPSPASMANWASIFRPMSFSSVTERSRIRQTFRASFRKTVWSPFRIPPTRFTWTATLFTVEPAAQLIQATKA